jgi:hypothetical protein
MFQLAATPIIAASRYAESGGGRNDGWSVWWKCRAALFASEFQI